MPSLKESIDRGNISGSPSTGEPVVYLAVGTLRRSHGIRGDVLVDVITDFPERLKPGTYVYLGENKKPIKITRRRQHNEGLLLGFEGIKNAEDVARYRTLTMYVRAEDRPPLPEGEYYHHQILGLNVEDESGLALGVITEIIETGANDVYVITPATQPARDILIPALKQVILQVDLQAKTMRIHLLPGLMDSGETSE